MQLDEVEYLGDIHFDICNQFHVSKIIEKVPVPYSFAIDAYLLLTKSQCSCFFLKFTCIVCLLVKMPEDYKGIQGGWSWSFLDYIY